MRIAADDPLSPKERDKGTIAAAYVKIITEGDTGTIAAMEKLALEYAKFNEFWNRVQGADAYITAATGWDRGKRPRDAERCWSAALELLDPLTQPFYARRLARVRATLAERWAATRPDEARKLAATALAWYRSAGGYDAEVAKLALIAARP
jgi:hypothetical protein